MRIVILIPTFKEAANVAKMVETIASIRPETKNHALQVLYVDGNSPDGTANLVREKQKQHSWLHLLVETKKEGLGMAYAKGMKHAMEELKADYLMEFDGDFQHPPEKIPEMITQIDKGYDYILGSRYIPGGSIPAEWGIDRKLLSVVGNLVARTCLILPHVHDVTGGFKLSRVKGFMDEFDFSKLLSKSFAYKIRRFLKFAVVGGTGLTLQTLFFEITSVFTHILTPSVATVIGGEIAIISNFTLNNLWTFKDYQVTGAKIIGKFFQFNLTSLLALVIQFVILRIGEFFARGSAVIIQFFYFGAIFIVLIVNYYIYNKFIWKTTTNAPKS